MTPLFSVRTTAAFDRVTKKLASKHAELLLVYADALAVLAADPHNRSRMHSIKKLQAVRQGEGQWRLRLARWRFRYDIHGHSVVLSDCSLRREDTYR